MDYEALMDGRQKHVHEHFSPNSKLNDPEFVKKLLDWITFWRRNPSRFVQRYFGITLYLYQHIILYLMDIFRVSALWPLVVRQSHLSLRSMPVKKQFCGLDH